MGICENINESYTIHEDVIIKCSHVTYVFCLEDPNGEMNWFPTSDEKIKCITEEEKEKEDQKEKEEQEKENEENENEDKDKDKDKDEDTSDEDTNDEDTNDEATNN